MDLATELRKLPKMDRLLELAEKLVEREGRAATLQALREAVEQARAVIQEGKACPREEELLAKARERLELQAQPGLRPVINATGVVIHTNLGRAPLSDDAERTIDAVVARHEAARV